MESTNTPAIKATADLLRDCRKKLQLYREASDGRYLGGVEYTDLIARIDSARATLATPAIQAVAPILTVWYGAMPESNGKHNFTAVLMRKDAMWGGPHVTIECGEYPDRIRYEADRVRHLIGELAVEPFILDYDADKHSGYVEPVAAVPAQQQTDAERQAALADRDGVPYMIVFDDADRKPELVYGGTRALYRFKEISANWNAHLFVKIKGNSHDDKTPSYSFAAPAAPVAPDLASLTRYACFEIEDGIYEDKRGSYVLFRDVERLLSPLSPSPCRAGEPTDGQPSENHRD